MLNNSKYYNQHTKNAIIAFGRMFSNLQIERINPNDSTKNQTLNIPLIYGPKEKSLVRIQGDPHLTNQTHTVLPCMSFEILSFTYDATRKLNRMNRLQNKSMISYATHVSATTNGSNVVTSAGLFENVTIDSKIAGTGIPANTVVVSKTSSSSVTISNNASATGSPTLTFSVDSIKQVFTPVPYNLDVSLYILTKSQEDNLQIVEQILPTFTPEYTVTIDAMPDLDLSNDVPIVLNSVTMDDEYEGDFQTRRFVTTTMNFTVKLNLYGGVVPAKVITKTITKFTSTDDINVPTGAKEVVTSTGTVPSAPVIDVWTQEF